MNVSVRALGKLYIAVYNELVGSVIQMPTDH